MNNILKKGKADGKFYDLMDFIDYPSKGDTEYGESAVEHNGIIYPERSPTDTKPGIYKASCFSYLKHPDEDEVKDYVANDDNIIDFNVKSVQEFVRSSDKLKSLERDILVDVDDIYSPIVDDNDEPEMVALKNAIISKNIDIGKYSGRFGSRIQYQNDIRLLKSSHISMGKLKKFLNVLDLDGYLVLEDSSEGVPNPMNEVIKVKLNLGGEE